MDLGRTVTLGQGERAWRRLAAIAARPILAVDVRRRGQARTNPGIRCPVHSGTSPPGDSTAEADVSARLVLVSIFSGERERATWELTRFQRRFPDAEGELSGRRAPWSKLLTDLLAKSTEWGGTRAENDWLRWGVEWDRTGRVAASIELSGKAVWSRPLTPVAVPDDWRDSAAHATSAVPPLLAVHPTVVGPYVVGQDGAGARFGERQRANRRSATTRPDRSMRRRCRVIGCLHRMHVLWGRLVSPWRSPRAGSGEWGRPAVALGGAAGRQRPPSYGRGSWHST